MRSVCILSAAWRRFDITRLVLAQRQRLCVELAARGVDAVSLIVADDDNLDIARQHGCETLEAPNRPLGRKCNLGLRRAAELADHVVWVGSDDWIHPDVFQHLVDRPADAGAAVLSGSRLAIVDMRTGRLQRIAYPSKYGAIPWILDSRLLRTSWTEVIRPDLQHGLDGALIRGLRLTRQPFEILIDDPNDFRCVDFKTRDNITPYAGLAKNVSIGTPEESAWATLRGYYPADLVAQARDLSERTFQS